MHKKLMSFDGPRFSNLSGSIIRHEVLNFILGPSKHMRFLVHQMKFCIKFDCANEFFDGGNFSKRGHWGCRGKAPARISKHCLVLGVGKVRYG